MRQALAGFCVLWISCAAPAGAAELRWTRDFVLGLELILIDHGRIENFTFDSKRFVTATVGTKEALTGPIWEWRIRGNKLQIIDVSKLWDEWTLLRRDEHTITVRRTGGTVDRFTYSRARKT